MKKIILYYTDNKLDPFIMDHCQQNLKKMAGDISIVSVSQQPITFGNIDITVGELERSRHSMYRQITMGLLVVKRLFNPDVVYMAEHDILYCPNYFDFVPTDPNTFYYYVYKYWMNERGFVNCEQARHLSGLTCNFNLLLSHMLLRLYRIEKLNMKKGGWAKSEPGCSDGDNTGLWERREPLSNPCVDIRHGQNLSGVKLFNATHEQQIAFWGDHTELMEQMNWKP